MMLNVSLLKKALKVSSVAAVVALGTATMRADQVTFTGTAMGAFNGGTPSNSSTYNTLTYSGSTFNTTTVNGTTNVGGNPNPGSNYNNFGSISVATAPAGTVVNDSTLFDLLINFSAPAGTSNNGNATYTAKVKGSVDSDPNDGGVSVKFQDPSQTFYFSNGSQSGSFTLDLNNFSVNSGQTASITGTISSTVTPEPMSLALLGTGLMGIAFIAYRRTRTGEAAAMPLAF